MSGAGVGVAIVMSVSCGTPPPGPLPPGVVVTGSDVRVGLTADDRLGGPGRLTGSGFQQIAPNSHVASVAEGVVRGSLNDGGNALAVGDPESNWVLRGQVLAKPGAAMARSDARVVEISTMDLEVAGRLPGTRLVMESVLTPTITGDASALYEIDAELSYEGTVMGRVRAEYAVYPVAEAGMVEVFRGRRGTAGSRRIAMVRNGAAYKLEDPSFYVDLGPGAHQLIGTIKLSATAPDPGGLKGRSGLEGRGGVAGVEVEGRLRLESKGGADSGRGGAVRSAAPGMRDEGGGLPLF